MAKQALARLQPVDDALPATGEVLVHVRFSPNGEIFSIGEKPERLGASEWLKHLFATASPYYQVFAGGRGFFRIPKADFEALLEALPA